MTRATFARTIAKLFIAAVIALSFGMAAQARAQTVGLDDVPQDAYYATPVVEFHASGVFDGTLCGDGFCPSTAIDRKTMAVWTVRLLDGQDPPPAVWSRFGDVNAAGFHAPFIERMADLGITAGCGDGTNFCPDRSVTRAEMAVFLSRAYDLPVGAHPGFSDVPDDSWYAAYVARLAVSGITAGCGTGTTFCPSDNTTRAQMAAFLWRAEAGAADFDDHIELAPERSITVKVHYCGPPGSYSRTQLEELVGVLTQVVGGFFRIQSGSDDSGEPNRKYAFQVGEVVSPAITWSDNLDDWDYSHAALCLLETAEPDDRALLVAGAGQGGRRGVAWYGGPAIVKTDLPQGMLLAVAAHELGHAFEGFAHPWMQYPQLCQEISGIISPTPRSVFISDTEEAHCLATARDQGLPQWLVDHLLGSIMSYSTFGSVRDLGADGSGPAYIACYQRAERGWGVTAEDCAVDPGSAPTVVPVLLQPPDAPAAPVLVPGDGQITVRWSAPADNGSVITGYYVDVLSEGGAWVTHGPYTALARTIYGLANGVRHEVQVQAVNAEGSSDWSASSFATPRAPAMLADPCKVESSVGGTTVGFPLPDWAAPSTGTVRVAVLFMDFPDKRVSEPTTEIEAVEESLTYMENYLEQSAAGRLDLEFVVLREWLRASDDHQQFLGRTMFGSSASAHSVDLASSRMDLSGVDAVMTVFPSDQFSVANAGGTVSIGGETVPTFRMNVWPRPELRGIGSNWWAAAHELLHAMGLTDLYVPRGFVDFPSRTSERALVAMDFGIMGFTAYMYLPYSDPRLDDSRLRSEDYRVDYWIRLGEMLGWSRWQLGWIDPDETQCITESSATVTLGPVTGGDDGARLAVVPVSRTKAIALEARRAAGRDDDAEAARNEGVLVYTVDATEYTLPIKPAVDDGSLFADDHPLLRVGESLQVSGYTIGVVDDDGTNFTVVVTEGNVLRPQAPAAPPDTPEAPVLVPGDGQITVRWSAPADNGSVITGYYVDVLSEGGVWVTHGPYTALARTIYGLANGVRHEVQVQAVNAEGSSDWSASSFATPQAPAAPPDTPAAPVLVPGDGRITVRWSAPADNGSVITGYYVDVLSEGGVWVTHGPYTALERTIYGFANGVRHEVQVQAVNAEGSSGWSASSFATPRAAAGPPDTPAVHAVVRGTTIEASWSAHDNGLPIDKWEVSGVGEVPVSTTGRVWRNVQPGSYVVAVRVHNAAGWSEWGISETLTVAEPRAARSVTLTKGASAQGWTGCSSVYCRHLEITLNDFSADSYTVECRSSLSNAPWHTGTWRWPGSSPWQRGGCWFGYPGEQVWVVVDGVRSNTITW